MQLSSQPEPPPAGILYFVALFLRFFHFLSSGIDVVWAASGVIHLQLR
jgi:hypothetical protein